MTGNTLHEALDAVAAASPGVVSSFPSVSSRLTLAELAESSRVLAAGLLGAGVDGEPVGVLSPNAPEFVQSVFAVSRAGATICPLPLPTGLRDVPGYLQRLARIVEAAGIRHVVASSRLRDLVAALPAFLPGVTVHDPDQLAARAPASPAAHLPTSVAPEIPAMVQFTSGSTSLPKGVRLSHANVLAGLTAISEGIAMRPGDRGRIWLPLFHDMGLFGTLSGLLYGIPVDVTSPASFVKDPARWLQGFATAGATIYPGPNFGYDAMVTETTAEQVRALDLRAWRVAFNGAETIAVPAVEAFIEHFAPAGFAPEAMFPVYGLAEATLAVTFPPLGRRPVYDWVDPRVLAADGVAVPPRDGAPARGIVALGRPVRGIELRIRHAGGAGDCPDGTVGEVQVRGASVTSGYLAAADVAQPFDADGWLRTGDLGYRRGGDLYLTGRAKEMITVRGENYYPEDVESAARSVPGVYKRRCVAFADVRSGGECIVLVAETAHEDPADRLSLAAGIRGAVTAAVGLHDLDVHVVPRRSIPRTTSGKLKRLEARELIGAQATDARHVTGDDTERIPTDAQL